MGRGILFSWKGTTMKTFVCVTILFAAFSISPAQPAGRATNALKPYEIIQYATVPGRGPQNIMLMDNNGNILLACQQGATEGDLKRRGIAFTESQIVALETWRLLTEDNDTLKTMIPILDSAQTAQLRAYTRTVAAHVCDETVDLVRTLVKHLEAIHRSRNAFSIVFSYVVDGLTWRDLEAKKVLTERTISVETPLWAGEVWALYRPRTFECGTNSISDQGISIKVNWSDASIPKMIPFVADFKTLGRMFDDYALSGRVMDAKAMRVFGPFQLFDDKGQFTIPVIAETKSNKLYTVASALAQRITGIVINTLDLASLKERYNFRTDQQAFVIVYHEIMWDLMDAYEQKGLLQKPVAFADPSHARPSDISDLVFIVRQETKQ